MIEDTIAFLNAVVISLAATGFIWGLYMGVQYLNKERRKK